MKYLMIVNGERIWAGSIHNAGVMYDCGFVPVSIGGQVIEENGKERRITNEERRQIADAADEYSGSK